MQLQSMVTINRGDGDVALEKETGCCTKQVTLTTRHSTVYAAL